MNKIEDLKNKLQQIAVRISSTTDIGDQLALKRQKYNWNQLAKRAFKPI